ncbi:MAG: DedA family protein [Notoacmeibacter sp.]|nr:DedA family protein [Notoacmeibacter sp.]MCC0033577.1 DedA family protein [Brucellaceae bacterium]
MEGPVAGLAGLFVSAFTSATLLPGTSEALLTAMALSGVSTPSVLLTAATLGNVLGSCVNWLMGRAGSAVIAGRDNDSGAMPRARRWYARWGHWSLLASWVPVVGDPLTLLAGAMGEPLWRFVLTVTFAKAARYAAVLALVW